MSVSMITLVAAAMPVVGTILGLLFACFGIIFGLAMFIRVVSGPGRRAALLIGAALVLLAAIRFVDGPWPGGRSLRPGVISWKVNSTGNGEPRHAPVIQDDEMTRSAEHTEANGIDIRNHVGEAVEVALRAVEAVNQPGFALGMSHEFPSLEPPVVPVATGSSATAASGSNSTSAVSQVRSTTRQVARHARNAARHVRSEARRSARGFRGWLRARSGRGIGGMLVPAFALVAFLFVGYVFLDAGTRGQFTWSLRLVSMLAFVLFFAALALWPAY